MSKLRQSGEAYERAKRFKLGQRVELIALQFYKTQDGQGEGVVSNGARGLISGSTCNSLDWGFPIDWLILFDGYDAEVPVNYSFLKVVDVVTRLGEIGGRTSA